MSASANQTRLLAAQTFMKDGWEFMSFTIEVHLHTILQKETPEGVINRVDLDLAVGTMLGDVLNTLEITLDSDSLLLVVNGRMADINSVLTPGDVVHLMPAISGGAYPSRGTGLFHF
jgi:molybdopterin converting factor small subunit